MANKLVLNCETGEAKVVKTTKAEDASNKQLREDSAIADSAAEAEAMNRAILVAKLKSKTASSDEIQEALAVILGSQ